MFDLISSWFANGTFQAIYLTLLVILMVGPMIWLSRWYHRNIGKTGGGRRLQEWQRRNPAGTAGGLDAAFDIERGDYGQDAKRMQHRVYWFVSYWVIAIAVFGGIAIYFMPSA
jgi:hypothetical protein